MKKTRIRLCIILTVIMFTITFIGCNKSIEIPESQNSEINPPTTLTTEDKVSSAPQATLEVTLEPTPKPTIEPTPEPTPELIVYEGIDMESTLPGIDWMATFSSVFETPKFVVFNDETNKKQIIENEQSVEFSTNDTLAIFVPSGYFVGGCDGTGISEFVTYNGYCCEIIFRENYKIAQDTIIVDIYDANMEKSEMKCTILPSA